jgi:hypothetical protein
VSERAALVVIGGGVIGASVCYRLAQAGARVTCVERSFPAAGATGASFSVDVTARTTPRSFFDLSVAAAWEHAALEDELGAAPWRSPAPALEWGRAADERDAVRDRVQRLRDWGYPAELVEREAAQRLAPAVRFAEDDDARVALYPEGAWYDVVVLTQLLLWHDERPRAGAVSNRRYFSAVPTEDTGRSAMGPVRASDVEPQAAPRCPDCGQPMLYKGGTYGFVHCSWMLLYREGGWLDEAGNVLPDRRLNG